ncbi:MAG: ABC transporter ATP-binding protein [Deltaproteobacteria bacterium]|nr:ABC transporter ATP-binding protein [Deltaproteobacteria bacterium]MBW2015808.1 ABC transporter ATP-binding protein [Deltaproteobacteria bacterium]MBW2129208.1 ABC transporter ATP-binding protein [Deltaproteobacteria bacterium]MBW2303371.1 ABC transporter ATP-binding protein [Deltaproteobacteria bacterium]
MLNINNLNVSYGDVQVLFDVSCSIEEAELVSIVGANAAGKSTLLRAISGILRKVSGSIRFKEKELVGMPAHEVVSLGIVHIPQGRRVFPAMTVQENLELGFYSQRAGGGIQELLNQMYDFFPELSKLKGRLAGRLSGGEQQMLAIARGLMARPVLLTVDEPSLGLAPILVEKTFQIIERIKQEKVTILLVEQNVFKALNISDHAYVIENGRIVMQGLGKDLLQDEHLKKAYLGM